MPELEALVIQLKPHGPLGPWSHYSITDDLVSTPLYIYFNPDLETHAKQIGAEPKFLFQSLNFLASYFTENAMWMESLQLFLFGDGGGELKNFVGSLEVVAHEFTHAVISSTSRFEYVGQSGALNEHFADVFGIMALYYFNPKTENPFLVGNHSDIVAAAFGKVGI